MPRFVPKPSPQTIVLLGLTTGIGIAAVLCMRRRRQQAQTASEPQQEQSAFVPSPRPGDILLFHNARGLNRLITWFTGSPFYHAGLYAGDNKAVEARTPGVQYNDLSDRAGNYAVAPAPQGKGKAALAWAKTQIGDAYDNWDVAVIILDRLCRFLHFNYTPNNKYSCGEFVATAFDKAGAHLFPERDLGDIVPGDFAFLLPEAERERAR